MSASGPVIIQDEHGLEHIYLLLEKGCIWGLPCALVSLEEGEGEDYIVCGFDPGSGRYYHFSAELVDMMTEHWFELNNYVAAVA